MAVMLLMDLYKKVNDFRAELAEALCIYKISVEKRGRPSNSTIERELEAKKPRRKPLNSVPVKDVRTDGIDHNERRCEKNRCRLPGCKEFSRTECTNCLVALCHTRDS